MRASLSKRSGATSVDRQKRYDKDLEIFTDFTVKNKREREMKREIEK